MLKLFVLILFPFISLPSFAEDGLLFSVEKDGKTSYLFGTQHSVTDSLYSIHPEIEKAIKRSHTVLIEHKGDLMDAYFPPSGLGIFQADNETRKAMRKLPPGVVKRVNEFFKPSMVEGSYFSSWQRYHPGVALAFVNDWSTRVKGIVIAEIRLAHGTVKESSASRIIDDQVRELAERSGKKVYALDVDGVITEGFVRASSIADLSSWVMKHLPLGSVDGIDRTPLFEELPKSWQSDIIKMMSGEHESYLNKKKDLYKLGKTEEMFRVQGNDFNVAPEV